MAGRRSGSNRFGWLTDEEDPRTEVALREEARIREPPAGVLDVSRVTPAVARRRRRNRGKYPKALGDDPYRMMAGAHIRRGVRRRVD